MTWNINFPGPNNRLRDVHSWEKEKSRVEAIIELLQVQNFIDPKGRLYQNCPSHWQAMVHFCMTIEERVSFSLKNNGDQPDASLTIGSI